MLQPLHRRRRQRRGQHGRDVRGTDPDADPRAHGRAGHLQVPGYSTGNLLWYEDGKLTPYTGPIPPASNPAAAIELGEVVLPEIDQMAQTVPLDAPWTAPNALPWDSITADSWAADNIKTADGQKLFSLAVNAVLSVLPRDVSFLYFLFYVHAAGGIEPLVNNAGQGSAQDFRVSGGTQGIAVKLADQLGRKRILLSQPVRRISQGPKSVYVYADKATVKAQQVVVAIPPHLAGRIVYEPGLPAVRDQLTQRMPIGSLIKTIAVYDTPVLARPGPQRPGDERHRAGDGDVRRLAGQRHARGAAGVHRRRRRPRAV